MIKINDVNKTNELSGGKGIKKTSGGESFSAYLNQTIGSKPQQVASSENRQGTGVFRDKQHGLLYHGIYRWRKLG